MSPASPGGGLTFSAAPTSLFPVSIVNFTTAPTPPTRFGGLGTGARRVVS